MQLTKNTGRVLGVFFLLTFISGVIGTINRGLSGAGSDIGEFLTSLSENAQTMNLSIGLDMVASLLSVWIAVFLYPWMKKWNERAALAYLALSIVSLGVISMSNMVHAGLLSLGEDYASSNSAVISHFGTLASMGVDAYYWAHFLVLSIYGISGLILHFFLGKTKLVPIWLAVWGFLASTLVFFGGSLQLSGLSVSFYLFAQNGIFMLAFMGWLLAMGFRVKLTLDD